MTMRIALAFLTTLARQISRRVGGRVHYGAPFVGLVDQPSPLKQFSWLYLSLGSTSDKSNYYCFW